MEPHDAYQVTPSTTRLLDVPVVSDPSLAQYATAAAALGDPTHQGLAPVQTQTLIDAGLGEPPKRKRGRPPKDPVKAAQQAAAAAAAAAAAGEPIKRKRGRPPGSKNKIVKNGAPMVPQVLLVQPGEDVVEKLKDLARGYHRSLCILAASGTLSAATLAQIGPTGHGVGVTLRGHFTILSISGAILQQQSEEGTTPNGSGGGATPGGSKRQRDMMSFISASLANPTGGVVGGTVAGALEANSVVTVVIGHWEPENSSMERMMSLPLGDDSDGKLDVQLQQVAGQDLVAAVQQQQQEQQAQHQQQAAVTTISTAAVGMPPGMPMLGQFGGWQPTQPTQ